MDIATRSRPAGGGGRARHAHPYGRRSADVPRCACRHRDLRRFLRRDPDTLSSNAAHIDPAEASATPSPEDNDRQRSYGARFKEDRKFSLASASLRQALQDMPEISEASKHIMLEETKQGLNIEIVDQDGRSMFPEGAKEPYERTRKLIQKLAPQLKAMPYRLSIVGHTASSKVPPKPGYGPWELSADRANAVRQILDAEGFPSGNIFMVAGKADTDPLFPDDPSMSPNRRVTITLMREEPPLPDNLTP